MSRLDILPSRNEDYGFFRTLTVCPQREYGIPAGLPYLTGWVQHFAVTAAMEDAN